MKSFHMKVGQIIPNKKVFPEKMPVYSPFLRIGEHMCLFSPSFLPLLSSLICDSFSFIPCVLTCSVTGIHRQWFREFETKLGTGKPLFLLKTDPSLDHSSSLSLSPGPFSFLVSLQSVELTVEDLSLDDTEGVSLYCHPTVKHMLPKEGELWAICCDGIENTGRKEGKDREEEVEIKTIHLQACTSDTNELIERMVHEHPQDLAWLQTSMWYVLRRYPMLCPSLVIPCDVMASSSEQSFIPMMRVNRIGSSGDDAEGTDHIQMDMFFPCANGNGNVNVNVVIDDQQKKQKGSEIIHRFREHLIANGFNCDGKVAHVLVMGPSGSGKSHMLHQWCAHQFPMDAVSFAHCPSLVCGGVSETVRSVRDKWEGMACIVLDDIDLVFSQRSEFDTIHRILLSEILRILDERLVHVFASASDSSQLVDDLRQEGRFSKKCDFFMPIDACIEDVRRQIGCQDADAAAADDDDDEMDGFLPCDVLRLKKESAVKIEDSFSGDAKKKRKKITALQKYQTEVSSDIRFSDLFGLDEAIELVKVCRSPHYGS
jgi:hypothetical protein